MAVIGSRERTRILDRGTFRCPRESRNRRYTLVSVRTWHALGSMALVPGSEHARFVECQNCHSTFDTVALERPHTHLEDTLTTALRYAVGAVLGAERPLGPSARRSAVIVLQRHASTPYRSADLDADLDGAADDTDGALSELAWLAPRLTTRNRATFVDAMVQLVSQDRPVRPERLARLAAVVDTLGIERDEVTEAMRRRKLTARLAV